MEPLYDAYLKVEAEAKRLRASLEMILEFVDMALWDVPPHNATAIQAQMKRGLHRIDAEAQAALREAQALAGPEPDGPAGEG